MYLKAVLAVILTVCFLLGGCVATRQEFEEASKATAASNRRTNKELERMIARVENLEYRLSKQQETLAELKSYLGKIDGKIDQIKGLVEYMRTGNNQTAVWESIGQLLNGYFIKGAERTVEVLGKFMPGIGQRITLRRAVEQFGIEIFFKRLDPPANGSVIDTQLLTGSTQSTGAGDGQEVAIIIPVHAAVLLWLPYFNWRERSYSPSLCIFAQQI